MSTTHFFLGANSGQGFQNLFPRFCRTEDFHDLIVLKGGPGVGKSTLMRTVGKGMEERGEEVEYFYCSGDPGSLDGVHIPRIRTAIVDGTAPHGRGAKGQFCGTSMAKDEGVTAHTNLNLKTSILIGHSGFPRPRLRPGTSKGTTRICLVL